ncbi:MAG TPA: elongation factor P maturation arginine rhamnosyltransferase EarP [Ramlibacter sp.]|nr:elongation factor P maturation arginine rhamnosyltransferase EarP [Ramlibacter sp.]
MERIIPAPMRWDIFCKLIDNHGDIGVCWRLSAELARRGEAVRLWVDNGSALAWMAPGGQPGVQVLAWAADDAPAEAGDVVIEAFGCQLGDAVEAALARRLTAGRPPAWINLEYLSAEAFVERNHGLPSPVLSGPAAGAVKRFFYPGFTQGTGGLIRELDLEAGQAAFDRAAWLAGLGIAPCGERLISLFCYEPPGLPQLLAQLAQDPAPTRLLVTAGRAAAAVRAGLAGTVGAERLAIDWLPLLSQRDYDRLLWACDLNFVRGEDSLVRALWAGRPLVWQPYPQHDAAHLAKLEALLDWLQAPPALRGFHQAWSDGGRLQRLDPASWTACIQQARQRLLAQDDLITQLSRFASPAGGADIKSR